MSKIGSNMTDEEKGNAIDWLTDIAESPAEEWTPFYSFSETRECAKNALALLKEQQKLIDDITRQRMENGAFD